jgi:hypothetical protein
LSTPDPEVRAIKRNLHEVADAIHARQLAHLIEIRRVPITGNFLYLAHRAFFFGMLGHMCKVLDRHPESASFPWLYENNTLDVDAFVQSNGYDINQLWVVAEGARLIRNKTLFHIDRATVPNTQAVWRKAGISGSDVGRTLDTVWLCLQHLHHIKVGEHYSRIPSLDLEPTVHLLDYAVEVIEQRGVEVRFMPLTEPVANLNV